MAPARMLKNHWRAIFLHSCHKSCCSVHDATQLALGCRRWEGSTASSGKWNRGYRNPRSHDHYWKLHPRSDHCMYPSLTDLWKDPAWRDWIVQFHSEHPYKWHSLPEVRFKGSNNCKDNHVNCIFCLICKINKHVLTYIICGKVLVANDRLSQDFHKQEKCMEAWKRDFKDPRVSKTIIHNKFINPYLLDVHDLSLTVPIKRLHPLMTAKLGPGVG